VDDAVVKPDGTVIWVPRWRTSGFLRDLTKGDESVKRQTITMPFAKIQMLGSDTVVEGSNVVILCEESHKSTVQTKSTTPELAKTGVEAMGVAVSAWDKGKP
jgi:hypothetical protein